jgi:hypothetical protein
MPLSLSLPLCSLQGLHFFSVKKWRMLLLPTLVSPGEGGKGEEGGRGGG